MRNRLRNLRNAREALVGGDPQAAANSLQQSLAAQRELDGVPVAPVADLATMADRPHRDFTVNPSHIDRAKALVAQENERRVKIGAEPFEIEVTRQHKPVADDDILVWEQATVRVIGPQSEVSKFALPGMRNGAEKRVNTYAVLEAACASTRLNGGQYVSRQDGPDSTPGQVDAYIADGPGSAARVRLSPTAEDKKMAREVRIWTRLQPASNEYLKAVRNSVAEETMSLRDAGTASSAVSGFLKHKARLAASANGSAAPAAPGAGSKFLGRKDEEITLVANVTSVERIYDERRTFPGYVYLMRTPDGNLVRWKAASTAGLEIGDVITLSGKVKAHSMAGEERQTEVYYCRPRIHNATTKA